MDHCVSICTKQPLYSIYVHRLSCTTVIFRCLQDIFLPCNKYSTKVGLKVVQSACSVQSGFTAVMRVILLSLNLFKYLRVFFLFFMFLNLLWPLTVFSFDFWITCKIIAVKSNFFFFFFYPPMIYFHFVFKRYECIGI